MAKRKKVTVEEIMERHGCDRVRAAFIAAIENGDLPGDCIELDEDGRMVFPDEEEEPDQS